VNYHHIGPVRRYYERRLQTVHQNKQCAADWVCKVVELGI